LSFQEPTFQFERKKKTRDADIEMTEIIEQDKDFKTAFKNASLSNYKSIWNK
jgi:hypothetical protein